MRRPVTEARHDPAFLLLHFLGNKLFDFLPSYGCREEDPLLSQWRRSWVAERAAVLEVMLDCIAVWRWLPSPHCFCLAYHSGSHSLSLLYSNSSSVAIKAGDMMASGVISTLGGAPSEEAIRECAGRGASCSGTVGCLDGAPWGQARGLSILMYIRLG